LPAGVSWFLPDKTNVVDAPSGQVLSKMQRVVVVSSE
jgi:hypothetical protein